MRQISFPEINIGTIRHFFFSTDLRKGLTISVASHLAIAGVIAASFISWEKPIELEDDRPVISAFDVSGVKTDSDKFAPIPEISAPSTKENAIEDPIDAPVQEVAFNEGGTGDDLTVWTPEPPTYGNAPGKLAQVEGEKVLEPSAFEFIQAPKEGSEPTLISFEPGSFSGAKEIQEAIRLSGEGNLTMQVLIDVAGKPIGCSVVESSGSNILDDLGCGLIMTYRYDPGKDGDGVAIESSIFEVLEWSKGDRGDAASSAVKRRDETTEETMERLQNNDEDDSRTEN